MRERHGIPVEPVVHAQNPAAGSGFAEIESFVRDEMAAQRIPGLALGIVDGDRIAYMRGFGTADDAETEMGRDWERAKGKSRLNWERAKHATRDAWHRVEEKLPGDADRDGR